MNQLRLKPLWLLIGYLMVAFVIYSSLTTSPLTPSFKFSDKFMHIVGYFGLMGWFIQIYQQKKTRILLAVIFICMGVLMEFLQDLGGVRYFEVNDMLANATGVLLAWALVKTPLSETLFFVEKKLLKQRTY